MPETMKRVCDHCGAPLRGLVDGYCPYCRTRPFPADGGTAGTEVSGMPGVTAHSVLLLDAGPDAIAVIRALRDIVQREFQVELGLADAQDLVGRASPSEPPALIVGVEAVRAQRWVDTFSGVGASVAIQPPLGSVAPPPATAVPTGWGVYLTDVGRKKINVIKAVRGFASLGLAEAKDLVDAAERQPQLVVTTAEQAHAATCAQQLADAGATAEVRAG